MFMWGLTKETKFLDLKNCKCLWFFEGTNEMNVLVVFNFGLGKFPLH
jgi:hypothetical protein